jgi:hypothetical protein
MAGSPSLRLLAELEECRYRFGRSEAVRSVELLRKAETAQFTDVPSLIRFHEVLLVLRAFPPSPQVLRRSEKLLQAFWKRVESLRKAGLDMDDFDPLEVSGIAGTSMQDTLGFDLVRWLVKRLPGKVEIAWEDYDDERAMGTVWPTFLPLLEEDTMVEANIPWRKWLKAAQGRGPRNELACFVRRFEELNLTAAEVTRLYDSLRMPVRWYLENSQVSRTRNWRHVAQVFYQTEPLLSRRDVSLETELARRPPDLIKLSPKQGDSIMDLIREVMLVRYRELYGTTLGDPRTVVRADVGRGVSIYLWNLPPERRLPLRAYVAGLTLKNGVPINYIEAIGLFEWMEVGFNTFYTFRGGEVAWIFAQVLRCLCSLMGTTCISMYPYQLGHNNEEAIESGAFWFYRKLGFRPGRPELMRLVEREEARIARDPSHRTPARTLRRLAQGYVFHELAEQRRGDWDNFSTRNIGLRVNQAMARKFDGNSKRFRQASARRLGRLLKDRALAENEQSRTIFENFAVVLSLVPKLRSWTSVETKALADIFRARCGRDEMRYLHLLQRHSRLRDAILRLGSPLPR